MSSPSSLSRPSSAHVRIPKPITQGPNWRQEKTEDLVALCSDADVQRQFVQGPTFAHRGESTNPSRDADSTPPQPSTGAHHMHQLLTENLLQFLVEVSDKQEVQAQAWQEEDLAHQKRWWVEDITQETA
ncbi:hypothetical protein Y1Q_0021097 [Alligator mississippiensis]|uniref:Uncharacterized protein n=1 Tax=Alligator mississippiensis TaxID=8496 RepID=A0A151NRN3_ALLMI|nr:hypothetical protein Y1Q_0021097 [Alligator mississippiensis]